MTRRLLWEVRDVCPRRVPPWIMWLGFYASAALAGAVLAVLPHSAFLLFPEPENEAMWPDVGRAVEHVESSGRANAVNGDAVGLYQIRPIMVEEVNRILELQGREERFDLDDRLDVLKSRAMFGIYSLYWCEQRADWTIEGIARRWAGGPDGHREEATRTYWERVRAAMNAGDNGSPAE